MNARPCVLLALVAVLARPAAPAPAWPGRRSFGFRVPVYVGPCYGCYPYYRPVPVIVEPAPVLVQPVPVLQAAPAVPPGSPAPAPQPLQPVTTTSAAPVADGQQAEVQRQVDR